jgi:hypothetical protein
MIVIPGTPQPALKMPSETNLLMALAEMQKQGRFDPVAGAEGKSNNVIKLGKGAA